MRSWSGLAVAVLACVCLAGCQRGPDLSKLGSPANRLVGHWMASDGHEAYFGPTDAAGVGEVITTNGHGKPSQQQYHVLSQDPRYQRVSVAIDGGKRAGDETVTIDEDGGSASVELAKDQSTFGLARVDDAVTPATARYAIPPAPGSTVGGVAARGRLPYAPGAGPRPPAVNGAYHLVLVGYNGMKPIYAWKPLAQGNGPNHDGIVTYSHGIQRRHSYIIWLHAVAFAMLLISTLLFGKDIGGVAILIGWGVAIAIGLLGVFVLHRPMIAGILEIIIGFVLLARGLFPKSNMLS